MAEEARLFNYFTRFQILASKFFYKLLKKGSKCVLNGINMAIFV